LLFQTATPPQTRLRRIKSALKPVFDAKQALAVSVETPIRTTNVVFPDITLSSRTNAYSF